MLTCALRFVATCVLVLCLTGKVAAQSLVGLAGSWALDRTASTFGPGDPGADRVDITLSPTEVTVKRFYNGGSPGGSVWQLMLDGTPPPAPRNGSARVIDGKLLITHKRGLEVVTHAYSVDGDAMRVERSIQSGASPAFRHTMVFKRIDPLR
jgi:hypothetical protein